MSKPGESGSVSSRVILIKEVEIFPTIIDIKGMPRVLNQIFITNLDPHQIQSWLQSTIPLKQVIDPFR